MKQFDTKGRENSGNCACFSSPGGRGPGCTALELRRNGFFPILIVILLLISKNLSRARLRLGLRLRACQCGPAAGLNSMAGREGVRGRFMETGWSACVLNTPSKTTKQVVCYSLWC